MAFGLVYLIVFLRFPGGGSASTAVIFGVIFAVCRRQESNPDDDMNDNDGGKFNEYAYSRLFEMLRSVFAQYSAWVSQWT